MYLFVFAETCVASNRLCGQFLIISFLHIMSASLNCGSFGRHVGPLLFEGTKYSFQRFSKCKKVLSFYRAVTLTSLLLGVCI